MTQRPTPPTRYFGGLGVVEWKNLGELESLDLSSNELTHVLTPLAACTELRELKVASNKLTESISAEFAHCTQIHTFDVSNNELSGAIPTLHITRMPRLALLYLHGNRDLVCSPLQDLNKSLSDLLYLNMDNVWVGEKMPEASGFGKLRRLSMRGCGLTAIGRQALAYMLHIEELDLSGA